MRLALSESESAWRQLAATLIDCNNGQLTVLPGPFSLVLESTVSRKMKSTVSTISIPSYLYLFLLPSTKFKSFVITAYSLNINRMLMFSQLLFPLLALQSAPDLLAAPYHPGTDRLWYINDGVGRGEAGREWAIVGRYRVQVTHEI